MKATARPPIGTSAINDYDLKRMEGTAIAGRIFEYLHSEPFPEGLHWGHVGDMAYTVEQLRAISDRLFQEGEHAA